MGAVSTTYYINALGILGPQLLAGLYPFIEPRSLLKSWSRPQKKKDKSYREVFGHYIY